MDEWLERLKAAVSAGYYKTDAPPAGNVEAESVQLTPIPAITDQQPPTTPKGDASQ